MVPPKKMSLQEFFNDESYGGSWADEDIDMASISVPIERHSHYNQSSYNDPFGSHHGSSRSGGVPYDNGPPYIIKLLNLPITANDGFVEDLLQSRYTTFVKFKIVADPSSNILETHVIKKVAFVELSSAADLQKALKWHDLYYKGNRRVVVELADFNDFQHCIQFNTQHGAEIQQIQDDFIANKNQQSHPRHMALLDQIDTFSPQHSHANAYHPPGTRNPPSFSRSPIRGSAQLHSAPDKWRNLPALGESKTPALAPSSSAPVKHKVSPFGEAKPVDVLSKQQEIEKKLINLNNTTVQTLGPDGEISDVEDVVRQFHENASPKLRRSSLGRRTSTTSTDGGRRSSISILKRPPIPHDDVHEASPDIAPKTAIPTPAQAPTHSSELNKAGTPKLSPAPIPPSAYPSNGVGKSLAELLREPNDDLASISSGGRRTPTTKNSTPKPAVVKPVILKKKVTSSPLIPKVDLTLKESEFLAQGENKKQTPLQLQADHAKEIEIEDKLKKINDTLSKTNLAVEKKDVAEIVTSTASNSVAKEEPEAQHEIKAENSVEERPDFKKELSDIVKKSHVRDSRKQPHSSTYREGPRFQPNTSRRFNNSTNGHQRSFGDRNVEGVASQPITASTSGKLNNAEDSVSAGGRNFRQPRSQNTYDRFRSRSPTKNKGRVLGNKRESVSPSNAEKNAEKSTISTSTSTPASTPSAANGTNGSHGNSKKEEVVNSSSTGSGVTPEIQKSSESVESASSTTATAGSSASATSENDDTSSSTSFRGGHGRGRGRGRGRGTSSRGRGSRGGRGGARGNFNLHYVRSKPSDESSAKGNDA
ncbi:hypothetical protein G9P44_004012 [Scheffersomyces stipitis]|nr:hypothetical protein G9P44_004012 [Scheffersomyces stipitis]